MVDDEDIGMTLQTLGGNLKLAAQQLVQMANDNGGGITFRLYWSAFCGNTPDPAASWPRCSAG